MPVPERPPPEPAKLLGYWMEWERGETPPGRVMSNLKIGGLRPLLEQLAAAVPEAGGAVGLAPVPADAEIPGRATP